MRFLPQAAFGAAVLLSMYQLAAADLQYLQVDTPDGVRQAILASKRGTHPGPHPLVLLLHGHGGSASNIFGQTTHPSPLAAWLKIVDRDDVIAVALQGEKLGDGLAGWNDCRSKAPGNPHSDDVAFARAVIEQVANLGWLDRRRIYAMGMSNGGMMVQRLALELEPHLAAFAAVAGSLGEPSICNGAGWAVSALLIHGTDDPIVPYGGGNVQVLGRKRGTVMSASDNAAFWLGADHLSGKPVKHLLERLDLSGATQSTQQVWGRTGGVQVSLISVEGGGHTEPSIAWHYGTLYSRMAGAQNHDFESAEVAWDFFRLKQAP